MYFINDYTDTWTDVANTTGRRNGKISSRSWFRLVAVTVVPEHSMVGQERRQL